MGYRFEAGTILKLLRGTVPELEETGSPRSALAIRTVLTLKSGASTTAEHDVGSKMGSVAIPVDLTAAGGVQQTLKPLELMIGGAARI